MAAQADKRLEVAPEASITLEDELSIKDMKPLINITKLPSELPNSNLPTKQKQGCRRQVVLATHHAGTSMCNAAPALRSIEQKQLVLEQLVLELYSKWMTIRQDHGKCPTDTENKGQAA